MTRFDAEASWPPGARLHPPDVPTRGRDPRQGGLPDSPAHKRDPNKCALQFFPKLCGEQGACLRSMPVKPERSEARGSSIQQLVVLADEAESAERKRLEIGAGREQGRCLLFDAAAVTERRERVE